MALELTLKDQLEGIPSLSCASVKVKYIDETEVTYTFEYKGSLEDSFNEILTKAVLKSVDRKHCLLIKPVIRINFEIVAQNGEEFDYYNDVNRNRYLKDDEN